MRVGLDPKVMILVFIVMLCIFYYKKQTITNGVEEAIKNLQILSANNKNVGDVEKTKTATEKEELEEDKYYKEIKKMCGDLCDLEKKISKESPNDFLGTVKAKVDCKAIFGIDLIPKPPQPQPPSWNDSSELYRDLLSHGGKVDITEWYIDNAASGVASSAPRVFSETEVQAYIDEFLAGTSPNWEYGAETMIDEAADILNVTGLTILVIGSQTPWLEKVLLSKHPKKVVTLEYGWFVSEYPTWEFVQPTEFHERYLNGTMDKFDAIFTYSSVEHSGLGRYGDTLNPWGDIISIAEAWCVSKPDAKLVIGVPTYVNGRDRIEFNAHKVYGPRTYPYLATNWKFAWPTDDEKRLNPDGSIYQPLFIFDKVN